MTEIINWLIVFIPTDSIRSVDNESSLLGVVRELQEKVDKLTLEKSTLIEINSDLSRRIESFENKSEECNINRFMKQYDITIR